MHLVFRLIANPFFRLACLAAALISIVEIFWLGAKPVAVNLIPPPWDKAAHLATYLTICFLLWFAANLSRQFYVVLAAFCVASADESRQAWLPGRHADWQDLAANVAALLIFLIVASTYSRFVNATTSAPSSVRSD